MKPAEQVTSATKNFDTHVIIKRMQKAGLTEVQSEEIVNAIVIAKEIDLSHLATKEQQNLLEHKFESLENKFGLLKAEIKAEIKHEANITLRWMMTFFVVIIGMYA